MTKICPINLTTSGVLALFLLLLSGCDNNPSTLITDREKALQHNVDSLSKELESSKKVTKILNDVGVLLDSIDSSRDLVRLNFEGEEPTDNYRDRMRDLNSYIRATNRRIADLDEAIRNSNSQSSEYIHLIERLKVEINVKTKEVNELKQQIENFTARNKELESLTVVQGAEISHKDELLTQRQNSIEQKDNQMEELKIKANMEQADAYFKAGEALELAAHRTQLAPRKKKETLKEALQLYKNSYRLGKMEAQAKIDKIEQQL